MAGKTTRVRIDGLDELRQTLLQLPRELQAGPLRSAVSASAKVVQTRAKELAPVDSGTTRNAIYRMRSREGSSAVQEMANVGIRYGKRYRKRKLDAWYWIFNEFGTSRQPARPFMRPAFDSTHDEQIEAMRVRLEASIARIARKLAGAKK